MGRDLLPGNLVDQVLVGGAGDHIPREPSGLGIELLCIAHGLWLLRE